MSIKTSEKPLYFLLLLSAVIRLLLAYAFPLGNDEAYYYTYAKYPDWSHFDHPSMVGWVIQFFSLNLLFSSEVFIRLGAVVAGTINTWLMYKIGELIGDKLTGWYSALLYTGSIYAFIIVGVFILPDAPQITFWLSALFLLLKALQKQIPAGKSKKLFLLSAFFMGLGMLSKYTTAFLWFGMVTYILIYDRYWLRSKVFYLSQLLILLIFSPVLIWNYLHNFISFTFHGNRVELKGWLPNINTFTTEWLGEFIYTNPILWILILLAVINYVKKSDLRKPNLLHLLLLSGLPLIITFLFVSFFRSTLPHWNGAGYLTLIPILAVQVRKRYSGWVPLPLKGVVSFMGLILLIVPLQIFTGFIPIEKIEKGVGISNANDYSLEMVGWHTLQKEFPLIAKKYEMQKQMPEMAPIISYRWFPAANYEYYLARHDNRPVLAVGDTAAIHGYIWINQLRGGFKLNSDAWYITSSRDFKNPKTLHGLYFEKTLPADTIPVFRSEKHVYSFYVYRLKNLQSKKL